MYYVVSRNGKCHIIEGNPKDPYLNRHYSIFSITCDRCLAFSIIFHDFYFMDELFTVYQLSRNENNRNLSISKEFAME